MIGQQMAVDRLNANVEIVKQAQETDRGILELVASSAGTGAVYNSGGSVQPTPVATSLNTQA